MQKKILISNLANSQTRFRAILMIIPSSGSLKCIFVTIIQTGFKKTALPDRCPRITLFLAIKFSSFFMTDFYYHYRLGNLHFFPFFLLLIRNFLCYCCCLFLALRQSSCLPPFTFTRNLRQKAQYFISTVPLSAR